MSIAYTFNETQCVNLEFSSRREWVLPNGIGGFAMGTVSGLNTRRYHGLLVAALHPPTERTLLFATMEGLAQFGNQKLPLNSNQYPGAIYPDGYQFLRSFELCGNHVRWVYQMGQVKIAKTIVMTQGKNEVSVWYENLGTKSVSLQLRPLVCFRDFHSNFHERDNYPQAIEFDSDQTVLEESGTNLMFAHPQATRVPVHGWYYRFEHMKELERGLDPRDDLYCPFELRYDLPGGAKICVVAATETPGTGEPPICGPDVETHRLTEWLSEATAKFLVKTESRTSILAGYPWFSDWGRDTMIALPGICLIPGRFKEARQILSDYASQMHQGLLPNRFVEKGEKADYNTVDATLWFGQAVYKTLLAEWDENFARSMFTALKAVVVWHTQGTQFGIKVDTSDGLLTQGEPGLQLTWMDAKVGDWVVTPRHGKPVEINGLWVNLLRVCEWLAGKLGENAKEFAKAAEKAEKSFDKKFWHKGRGHYLDTVDPDDASLRPNQLIAMALPFSPCNADHARQALEIIERELYTQFGMRTLGPNEPGYCGKFKGSVNELDAAYHQGTVWPWLLGPFITAYVKYGGSKTEAKHKLRLAKEMLVDSGLGGISECYDGDEPQTPGGCPWQAWSVGEILRAWVEDVGGD